MIRSGERIESIRRKASVNGAEGFMFSGTTEETDKQQCMYELRQKLKSLAIEFVVSYLPNFPDQLGECLRK